MIRSSPSHLLAEREKELDALYQIAALYSRPLVDLQAVLRQTAEIVAASFEFPEHTAVEIATAEQRLAGGAVGAVVDRYRSEHRYSVEKLVEITVFYHQDEPGRADKKPDCHRSLSIQQRERHLIDCTAALLADVLERRDIDEVLRESTRALQRQAAELEQKNSALREILSQFQVDKQNLDRETGTYVDTFVLPHLHQLRGSNTLSASDHERVRQLELSLRGLTAGQPPSGLKALYSLSPRETEICGLIRNGLGTKEIAAYLHITPVTVERHRNTIRRKLGITGRKISLTSYLRSLT